MKQDFIDRCFDADNVAVAGDMICRFSTPSSGGNNTLKKYDCIRQYISALLLTAQNFSNSAFVHLICLLDRMCSVLQRS